MGWEDLSEVVSRLGYRWEISHQRRWRGRICYNNGENMNVEVVTSKLLQ